MCFIYHLTSDPNLIKAVNRSTLANRMRDKLARPLTTDGVIPVSEEPRKTGESIGPEKRHVLV